MSVGVRLEPLGVSIETGPGTPLRDLLFPHGVEFPCGGRGKCRRCRVRVIAGELDPSPDERRILTPEEIAEGWRLACRAGVQSDVTLDIEQWESPVLADESAFAFAPREGRGVAVDLGTTTVVAQLVDLAGGHVLGVRTALNPQAAYGADIMSRVERALEPDGARLLREMIREAIGRMAGELAADGPLEGGVTIVGNTVMHHLFSGVDVGPLARAPFETVEDGLAVFGAGELGWPLPSGVAVRFLPCLGGFVGSDILAGIRATRLHESEDLEALIDLGTNGEIVVGSRRGLLCASTAAGPAFEGGRISAGMRAATGAIAEVTLNGGQMQCRVLGGGRPRGICGSGLVDAVRCALDLGLILPSGRLAGGARSLALADGVALTQGDIRELQLAKAAIAAGVKILLRQMGAARSGIRRVYLAGAFGNTVSRDSARRIGLLEFEPEQVEPVGNTALLGAKVALFDRDASANDALRRQVRHVPLGSDAEFHETYVEAMRFPEAP